MLALACQDPLVLPTRSAVPLPDSGVQAGLGLDGEACEMGLDCESGNCKNQICCASGECCREDADCRTSKKAGATCDQPGTCQGHKVQAVCGDDFRCKESEPRDDDSACTAEVEANSCGPYATVKCNGMAKQTAPRCPESCDSDDECDKEAHCADNVCVPDLGDAAKCATDGDCTSGHCSNQVCCESGTCCNSVADCADEDVSEATCDMPAICSGSRAIPACEKHQCTTTKIADDSACDLTVVANECGGMGPVKCLGGREQSPPPPCAGGTCRQYYDCARSAFCQAGRCVPDSANGERCTSADMCQSGHCEMQLCCSYDCCDNEKTRCPDAPCAAEVMAACPR